MITALKMPLASTILVLAVSILFNGCKKEEVEPDIDVSGFAARGGQISGGVKFFKTDDVAEKGVVIGLTPEPTIDNNNNSTAQIVNVADNYLFNELALETTYYLRAYTKSKKGKIKYSDERTFQTFCLEIDSITPKIITGSTAELKIYGRNFSSNAMDNTITLDSDCSSSDIIVGPSSATSTMLTIDLSIVSLPSSNCSLSVYVQKGGTDVCSGYNGGIISELSGSAYIYSYIVKY